jgi:hypothetical protein
LTKEQGGDEKADIGSHHEDVAVSEINEEKYAVDQGVAQSDECIKAAPLEGIE